MASNYWVHDLDPFLWQFPDSFSHWGPGGIRWYGIAYLAGFISAFFLLKHYHVRKRSPYDGEQIMNLMTFLVLGVLLGGRIGYALLYRWNEFTEDPLILLRVWEGGMASHGGFIGVCIAILWYARHSRQSPFAYRRLNRQRGATRLFFGRIANFINGELWGRTTEVSWGILFPKAPGFRRRCETSLATLRRDARRIINLCFRSMAFLEIRRYPKGSGQIDGGIPDCLCHCKDQPTNSFDSPTHLVMGMSRGQFYSLFLISGGFILVRIAEKRAKKERNEKDMEGLNPPSHGITLFFKCELITFDRTDKRKRKQTSESIIK